MKEEFSEFYAPTQQEFKQLWDKCTFVLDTNVLLDLYRYSPNASKELTDTLKMVSDRLWIPHQVAFEYNKNRVKVILNEESKFKKIAEIIDEYMDALKNELGKEDRARKNTYSASIVSALKKVIDKSSKEIKDELEKETKKRPDWIVNDDIRELLSELLKGKIGIPYNQKELQDRYEECQRRYDIRIPPGYRDAKTKEGRAKYGDAILWLQMINYAKGIKSPVIFVTRDDKVDWWNPETESKNDRQPDYELIKEFTSETGCPFYIYTTDRFLYWANKQIGANVSKETIEEIKQVKSSSKDAIDASRKTQQTPEATLELITAVMQSPELTEIVARQMGGERISSTDILKALSKAPPEVSSRVIKAILVNQKPVQEGDIIS